MEPSTTLAIVQCIGMFLPLITLAGNLIHLGTWHFSQEELTYRAYAKLPLIARQTIRRRVANQTIDSFCASTPDPMADLIVFHLTEDDFARSLGLVQLEEWDARLDSELRYGHRTRLSIAFR